MRNHSDLSHADGIRDTPIFITASTAVAAGISIAAAFAFRAVAQTLNTADQRYPPFKRSIWAKPKDPRQDPRLDALCPTALSTASQP